MKSSQAIVKQRVEEILQIRLRGAEFADIVQHAAQNGWNVKERQLWYYIEQGDQLLAETLEKDRGKLVNRHVAQHRVLFAHAFSSADYRTALAVMRSEAELLSLFPPKRTEITGRDGQPLQMETRVLTDDERRATVLAILAEESPGSVPAGPDVARGSGDMEMPGDSAHQGGDDAGSMAGEPTPLNL
jgi:hypothetical protein